MTFQINGMKSQSICAHMFVVIYFHRNIHYDNMYGLLSIPDHNRNHCQRIVYEYVYRSSMVLRGITWFSKHLSNM